MLSRRRGNTFSQLIFWIIGIAAFLVLVPVLQDARAASSSPLSSCTRTVKADIVAFEQAYLLNRFSAFVPAGMLFALRRDVVPLDPALGSAPTPGNAMLRPDKRPRPIVLRVNEGDCLEVTFTNLLSETTQEEGGIPPQNGGRLPNHVQSLPGSEAKSGIGPGEPISVDMPRTRAASFHIAGLEIDPMGDMECPLNAACGGDGSNVGLPSQQGIVFNPATPAKTRVQFSHGSLAMPGQTIVTRWRAGKDGAFFAYSMGAPVGGEGDGGQIGLGLFGAVNVEPAGSRWYRSQVSNADMQAIKGTVASKKHPYSNIAYEKKRAADGVPILNLLDKDGNIVHSDLNAIIVPPTAKTAPKLRWPRLWFAMRQAVPRVHGHLPRRGSCAAGVSRA